MDLRGIDLNLLLALDALLTERNVTRAADRLCIGQSAVSAQLARLRRVLDDPLLERRGNTLVPTPFAQSLVEPVRDAISRIDAIFSRHEEFDPVRSERTFTVIASDYVAITFLTPALPALTESAPGVRLHISPPGADYVQRVRAGAVDLAVMPREVFTEYQQVPHEYLFSDRFVCAVDATHPDVEGELTLEQFSSLPYLATSCGHGISPAESQLDRLGVTRNVELTTEYGMAPLMLVGTRRVALVHERLVRQVASPGSLRLFEPPIPMEPINEVMVWAARYDDDPGHRWLREHLRAAAASLAPVAA